MIVRERKEEEETEKKEKPQKREITYSPVHHSQGREPESTPLWEATAAPPGIQPLPCQDLHHPQEWGQLILVLMWIEWGSSACHHTVIEYN